MTKFTVKQIVVLIGNLLLGSLLGYNLIRLWDIHTRIQDQLQGNILSSNPELFIRQITQQDTPIWVWGINGLALLITLFFLIRQFIPALQNHPWISKANIIWLLLCLAYIVTIIVITVIAIASVFV